MGNELHLLFVSGLSGCFDWVDVAGFFMSMFT